MNKKKLKINKTEKNTHVGTKVRQFSYILLLDS